MNVYLYCFRDPVLQQGIRIRKVERLKRVLMNERKGKKAR